MSVPTSAYRSLADVYTKISRYSHAVSMLSWDSQVNMPPKGASARNECIAEITVLMTKMEKDPMLKTYLDEAESKRNELTTEEQSNLREIKRSWNLSNLLPIDLVEKKSIAEATCEQAWRTQRKLNDWENFLPNFRSVLALSREEAKILSQGMNTKSLYDALLEKYEPGLSTEKVRALFTQVKSWLPQLIQQVRVKQSSETVISPTGPFPVEKQRSLGLDVMKLLNFDFEAGRLDVSSHPFCGGVPQDVRLTTRYDEKDFVQSLMGIIHETGHSRYEQNLPTEWLSQPAGKARSMGIHESQSLFFEMQLGRSRSFLQLIQPLIEKHLGKDPAFELDNLVKIYSRVKPDFIRVDADELTYPLHVILRFEIEEALINGQIEAEDVPRLWQEKMKSYLDIDTTNNYKDGCMQDIHWCMGAFGYFPTYTLGAMYAAQYAAFLNKRDPHILTTKVASGDFTEAFQFLKDSIWSKGSLLETAQLIEKATGEDLNPQHFRTHLEKRYLHSS
eukprot:PhF_6_TR27332/c0_g1_i2/m.40161/K01299/E3.4.17.19; carboxypeptidase Taq